MGSKFRKVLINRSHCGYYFESIVNNLDITHWLKMISNKMSSTWKRWVPLCPMVNMVKRFELPICKLRFKLHKKWQKRIITKDKYKWQIEYRKEWQPLFFDCSLQSCLKISQPYLNTQRNLKSGLLHPQLISCRRRPYNSWLLKTTFSLLIF